MGLVFLPLHTEKQLSLHCLCRRRKESICVEQKLKQEILMYPTPLCYQASQNDSSSRNALHPGWLLGLLAHACAPLALPSVPPPALFAFLLALLCGRFLLVVWAGAGVRFCWLASSGRCALCSCFFCALRWLLLLLLLLLLCFSPAVLAVTCSVVLAVAV